MSGDAPSPTLASSPTKSRSSSWASLKLDLSNIPPLSQPTPPTNTLIITNLSDPEIFRPDNLQTIRDLICSTAPIYTWSPLKSFRRILVSFADEQAAISVRSVWDGESIMGERCRVYFGAPTPINAAAEDQHLALPDAGRLFFISPPPSPPHGWEMRLEDAPNKLVHADDLAAALSKLHHRSGGEVGSTQLESPVSPDSTTAVTIGAAGAAAGEPRSATRSRSSTLIYQPGVHGGSPNLPAIAVEDMTDSPDSLSPPALDRPILAHTARPPVELME